MATKYYNRTIQFSEQSKSLQAGYYLYALSYLGKIYEEEENLYKAAIHYQKILNSKEKESPAYQDAQDFFKQNKKRKIKKLKPVVEE